MVKYTPMLTDIALGSLKTAALAHTGSAGGDDFASHLTQYCKHITAMDLTGIISMTEHGFTQLIQQYKDQLVKIQVKRAMQISLEAFQLLAGCKKLLHLTLANVPHLDDTTVMDLLRVLGPQLYYLHLESLSISDEAISFIAQHCTSLVELRLVSMSHWEDASSLVLHSNALVRLQKLCIYDCPDLSMERQIESPLSHPKPDNESAPRTEHLSTPSIIGIPDMTAMDNTPLTPFIPPTPFSAQSPRMFLRKSAPGTVIAPHLTRLEIVACYQLLPEPLFALLKHWTRLQKVFYVGIDVNRSFCKQMVQCLPACEYKVYNLNMDSPEIAEME